MLRSLSRARLLASAALLLPAPALAQTPAAPAPVVAPTATGTRIFTPADFARFAPKTAYDLIAQVPGFTIRSADAERGLGQASENVLINGQRVANKSGGAVSQLQNVSAGSVERIEILDAASLGIAGLSGQVANVVLTPTQKAAGQFEYNPNFRAHYAKPSLLEGSVSYSGKRGPLDYTLSLKNDPGRGAFGGPIRIYDANKVLTETRHEVYRGDTEQPTAQVKLGYDGPGSSIGNLTASYAHYWSPSTLRDDRSLVSGETSERDIVTKSEGSLTDLNADYEFALGSGRLKLIGVQHWEHAPLVQSSIQVFDNGDPSDGTLFDRDTQIRETIGRGEYKWKSGANDWHVSLERAFNSLDQKAKLFDLDANDEFVEVDYPEGTGKVTEVRYEAIATLSRPITSSLDLQVAAGAETSRLDRVDDDQAARKFFRPKGSVNLAWRPAAGWDASLKLRRRVGQISFYDFLSQPKLSQDNENAGNPNLVPPQSWELEGEVARDLGRWGKTRLNLHYHRVEDIVDLIPIGEGGQGVGNLPKAKRLGFESVSTFQLDPLGWRGAKIDFTAGAEWTEVKDPLTAERRPIGGVRNRWMDVVLRHDVPGTQLAWTAYAQYNHYGKNYYPTEIYQELDLPWIAGFSVEHKNLFGLAVRVGVDNVFNGRHLVYRTVYDGYRNSNPISYVQDQDQLVGPIFHLRVRGNF